jgi:HPt (histidine-containing phosphotransfer) domain-containing protein
LTKPIDQVALLSAIEHLVTLKKPALLVEFANVADLTRHPDFSGTGAKAVNWAIVEGLKELGDTGVVQELSDDFLNSAGQILQAIRTAVKAGDRKSFRDQCHCLHSGAGNVGAVAVARLCQSASHEVKDLGRHGEAFCQSVSDEIATYRNEIARYLRKPASMPQPLF